MNPFSQLVGRLRRYSGLTPPRMGAIHAMYFFFFSTGLTLVKDCGEWVCPANTLEPYNSIAFLLGKMPA